MRVLAGAVVQESNTFSPYRSDLSFFESGCLLRGQDCLTGMAGTRTEFGGFIAACAREGVELVPTLAAWAASGGPMRATDFRRLADDLVDRVRGAGSAAGVLLALHGAWVAEGEDDPDGWILARVRQAVGPDVPVVATLDLHANVTAGMVRSADALVGYRTYPHVDMPETGERAAALLFRLLHGGVRAATRFRKVPMIVPPENAQTTDGPLGEVVAAAREAESRPGVLAVSVFPVQPWLDVAELGCAVVVVGADGRIAQREADHLARMLWERRRRFQVPLLPPDEAVARALAAPDGPILLVDSADGVSSGAPGDSTAILGALVRARPQRTALVSLVDPEAARAAAAADGQEIALAVGGRLDPGRHRPISVRGRARRVHDGKVVFTAGVGDGLVADMGSAAVLEVGSLRLLVMERPVPCYDPALYRGVGLDPTAAHVVVVKSPNNFRWTYRDIARDWIYVDAPGASTPRLESLTFTRAPRPLFPFDDWAWQPERAGAVGANP